MLAGLFCFAGMGVTHKMGDRWKGNALNIALVAMIAACIVTLIRATAASPKWFLSFPYRVVLPGGSFRNRGCGGSVAISKRLAPWTYCDQLAAHQLIDCDTYDIVDRDLSRATQLQKSAHAGFDRRLAPPPLVGSKEQFTSADSRTGFYLDGGSMTCGFG